MGEISRLFNIRILLTGICLTIINVFIFFAQYHSERAEITDAIRDENSVYYDNQSTYIEEYKNKYNEILEYKEKTSTITVFNNNSSFTKANIDKTVKDFKNIENLKLEKGNNIWIEAFSDYRGPDVIAVIFICIFILQFGLEMQKGQRLLTFSTYNGRFRLASKRIISICLAGGLCSLFFYGIQIISSNVYFGTDTNLERSLQSIPMFEDCPWLINVKEYILLYLMGKCMVCISIALIIWSFLCIFRGRKTGMLYTGIFFAEQLLTYIFIGSESSINHLKYINVFYFLDTPGIIERYVNLNFFSKPVNTLTIFFIVSVMIFILLSGICLYVENSIFEKRTHKSIIKKRKTGKSHRTGIISSEMIKLLFTMRGIIYIGVFTALTFAFIDNESLHRSAEGEIRNEIYAELGGKYNSSMSAEITKMKTETEEKLKEEGLTIFDVSRLENRLQAINTVEQQIKRLEKTYKEENVRAGLVDEISAEYIFGEPLRTDYIEHGFAIVALIALLAGAVYPLEKKSKMDMIIKSTVNGRNKLTIIKVLILLFIVGLAVAAIDIVELQNVKGKVGLTGLNENVRSFEILGNVHLDISLGGYIILYYVEWYVIYGLFTVIAMCISKRSKSVVAGQMMSAVSLLVMYMIVAINLPLV